MNNIGSEKPREISLKILILQLMELWHYLTVRWLIILIAGIIGAIAGFIYAFNKKPVYKAELTFALQDENANDIGSALGLASQFGFNFGGSQEGLFTGGNLEELMQSRSMVRKALLTTIIIDRKKQTLAERYITYNKLRDGWKSSGLRNIRFLPGTDPENLSFKQDSLIRAFHKSILDNNLTIDKKDKGLNIIAVDVRSEDELFAKYFAEVLVKEVSDFYVETRTKKESQNLAILQHQTDSVRQRLNAALSGVAASTDANPNVNPAMQLLRVPSQKRQVEVQTNTAILSELVKNLEVAKIALRKETPLIQVIDKPDLPLEKEKIGILKALTGGACVAVFLAALILTARLLLRNIMLNQG